MVLLQLTLVAAVPPIVTVVAPAVVLNPVPVIVMVIFVNLDPLLGDMLVTTGVYAYRFAFVVVWDATVTDKSARPEFPAGDLAVQTVLLEQVTLVDATPSKLKLVAPDVVLNPKPLIVIVAPVTPKPGEILVMVGK